jgi:hypothetical protein
MKRRLLLSRRLLRLANYVVTHPHATDDPGLTLWIFYPIARWFLKVAAALMVAELHHDQDPPPHTPAGLTEVSR